MSPLFRGKESRLPKKADHGAVHFSMRARRRWTEKALERDALRRKQEGIESPPISKRDLNFHIEEKEG